MPDRRPAFGAGGVAARIALIALGGMAGGRCRLVGTGDALRRFAFDPALQTKSKTQLFRVLACPGLRSI